MDCSVTCKPVETLKMTQKTGHNICVDKELWSDNRLPELDVEGSNPLGLQISLTVTTPEDSFSRESRWFVCRSSVTAGSFPERPGLIPDAEEMAPCDSRMF